MVNYCFITEIYPDFNNTYHDYFSELIENDMQMV